MEKSKIIEKAEEVCKESLSQDQKVKALKEEGFTEISISSENNQLVGSAIYEGKTVKFNVKNY